MTRSKKKSKRQKRNSASAKFLVGIANTIVISISATNLPLPIERFEASMGGFMFAAASVMKSSDIPPRHQLHSQSHNRHLRSNLESQYFWHRRDEAFAIPQEINRLPSAVGGSDTNETPQKQPRGIHSAKRTPAPVSRPTPAPLARPTPSPVNPDSDTINMNMNMNMNMNQQSSALPRVGEPDQNFEMEGTMFPLGPVPWADEIDSEEGDKVEEETNGSIVEPNEETTATGDGETTANANPETSIDENGETTTNGERCASIKEQDHSAMLAKDRAGEAGPSFLYSVTVSVVYEEVLVSSQEVPAFLDAINVPIALALSGCQDQRKLQSQSDITTVEYSEVEEWREFTTSQLNDGCSSATETEGLACGNYRSRAIIFLVDGDKTSALQEEFRDRTNQALLTHQALVTENPGIVSMKINSIAPVGVAPDVVDLQPDGVAPDVVDLQPDGLSAEATAEAAAATATIFPLSNREMTIVGSVAAGIGGICIGLLCMVYCRRSSRCINYNKHSRFDDDIDVASEDPDEWSPHKAMPSPHNKETVSTFPRFQNLEASRDFSEEEELERSNRVHSLLNNENKKPTSLEPRRAAALDNMRTAPTVSWSFDDGFTEDGTDEVAAKQGQYLWFQELMPRSPQRMSLFDAERPCFCSDTVAL